MGTSGRPALLPIPSQGPENTLERGISQRPSLQGCGPGRAGSAHDAPQLGSLVCCHKYCLKSLVKYTDSGTVTPVSFNLIVTMSHESFLYLRGLKPSAQPPHRGPHGCPLSFPWVLTNTSLLFHFPQTLSYPFLSFSPQPPRSFSTGVNYEAHHPSFIRGQRNSSNPGLRGPPAIFQTPNHTLLREEMSPTHSLSSK